MWTFNLPLLRVSVLYKHQNIPTAYQEDNEKYELIEFWLSEWWKGGKSVCVHRFSDACERNPSTAWDQKEWEKKEERWKSIGWIYLFSTQRRWNNRSFALEQSLLMMMNLCRTFLLATALRPCSSQSPNPADCNPSFSDSLPLRCLQPTLASRCTHIYKAGEKLQEMVSQCAFLKGQLRQKWKFIIDWSPSTRSRKVKCCFYWVMLNFNHSVKAQSCIKHFGCDLAHLVSSLAQRDHLIW